MALVMAPWFLFTYFSLLIRDVPAILAAQSQAYGLASSMYTSIMQWHMTRIQLGCMTILMKCCLQVLSHSASREARRSTSTAL